MLSDATKIFSQKQRHFGIERTVDPPRPAPSSQHEYPASQQEELDMLDVIKQVPIVTLSSLMLAGIAVSQPAKPNCAVILDLTSEAGSSWI